jgi:hypothetical protein
VPRTASGTSSTGRGRRRTTRGRSDTISVVGQISQLVAANETLQRENSQLTEENLRLRGELTEIGTALGRLTGAARARGRGRRGAAPLALPEIKPRRQRRPITDPEQLERRKQALAKARAARAEKLAEARAAASGE